MESEPFLLPSGSLNGDDTAGPREESSQMQVIESDTARADAAALATPTTADATKSGDVETDDDMSVEAADDGADSNYQPSDDDNDNSGIKKKEVYKREGGAATLKPAIVDLYQSSSDEKEVQKDPAFDKLKDIVLSLKDKTYEALLRPYFEQTWNSGGENDRSRVAGIFDALRKRLKSTGGSLYRCRNPYLQTDAFFDKSNLYLTEDEGTVMMKINQDLVYGRRRYHGKYGTKAQRKKNQCSAGIEAGFRRKTSWQDVIDDTYYKFLHPVEPRQTRGSSAKSTDAPHPTETDAKYQRSMDIVLSVKDQTYYRIVEPYWKAMWEERNDPKAEGAMARAKRAFAALRMELQISGGRFYRAYNAHCATDSFFEASNLYRVSDKDAVEKIKGDIYSRSKNSPKHGIGKQRKSKQSFDTNENFKPDMLMQEGETSKGKKRDASPTKSEESLPSSKRSRPDDGEHAKKWMANFLCSTIVRQTEIRKTLSVKCMRRGCRDEWYIIQSGLSRRDSAAVEGVNMFTGEQAILDECFRRGIYQQFVIDTEDGKEALEKAGIADDPYTVISKHALDSSRKQEAKVKDAGEEPQNTATGTALSRDKSSSEGTPNDLVKLADLHKVVCTKLSEAKSRAKTNALNAIAELGIEFYEALHSLMARKIGSAIDFGKINQSIDFFERITSQYIESERNVNDKIICGAILQQHLIDLETLLD